MKEEVCVSKQNSEQPVKRERSCEEKKKEALSVFMRVNCTSTLVYFTTGLPQILLKRFMANWKFRYMILSGAKCGKTALLLTSFN